jgi:flavin reductase (DIM6/NTAB) family NADH-FMN oxidoreductase RutF
MAYGEAFQEVMTKLRGDGLLLASTKRSGESNLMTIGWGTIGMIWKTPKFLVLVRPSRYTYEFIEDSGEFTVNVPTPEMAEFVLFCGTHSGRDVDKLATYNVATTPGQQVKSITVDECPIVYECRVVHKSDVDPEALASDIVPRYYSDDDFHRVYFGEILGVYGDR